MNATLPLCIAQALAPFAPPQSVVHQIIKQTDLSEAQRVAQDIAYEQAKQSGSLQRLNERRALEQQVQANPDQWGIA